MSGSRNSYPIAFGLDEDLSWAEKLSKKKRIPLVKEYKENYKMSSLCVDWFTIKDHIKDFTGKNVLVMGCGDGEFCRATYFLGATSVTGIDINAQKVSNALSRSSELRHKKCDFICSDVRTMEPCLNADVVINKFIFNYYYLSNNLLEVATSMYRNLKFGRRCYILMRNALCSHFWGNSFQKYGIVFENPEETEDGYSVTVKKKSDFRERSESVQNCLAFEIYEEILKQAGFINIRILPLKYNDICSCGPQDFWIDLFKNPHQMVVVAEKPNK